MWRPPADAHSGASFLVLSCSSLILSLPSPQGFVLDIYYQRSKAELQRCVRPDGLVPLVRAGMRDLRDFLEWGGGQFPFLSWEKPHSF